MRLPHRAHAADATRPAIWSCGAARDDASGVRVINCAARRHRSTRTALVEALQVGHLAGAALDVFVPGAAAGRSPASRLAAGCCHAAPRRLHRGSPGLRRAAKPPSSSSISCSRGMVGSRSTWPPSTAPSSTSCVSTSIWPGGLDCFMPRWTSGAIQRAELHYRGEVARTSTKLITASLRRGPAGDRPRRSRSTSSTPSCWPGERGIEIVEQTSSQSGDFSTLIQHRRHHRQEDLHGRRHALWQPVPAAGATGTVPARRLHGRASCCCSRTATFPA